MEYSMDQVNLGQLVDKMKVKPLVENPTPTFNLKINNPLAIAQDPVETVKEATRVVYQPDVNGELASKYLAKAKTIGKTGVKHKYTERNTQEQTQVREIVAPEEVKEEDIEITLQPPPVKKAKKMKKLKTMPELVIEPEMDIEVNEEAEPVKIILPEDGEIMEKPIEVIQPRQTKKTKMESYAKLNRDAMITIGDTTMEDRIPKLSNELRTEMSKIRLEGPPRYIMNNREYFIKFITNYFKKYEDDPLNTKDQITCDTIFLENSDMELLKHQKLIRDYINLYTPYRGLLLYHGLGAGKTCGSIAIAEGIKDTKKIYVMTPASLEKNYIEEIKKCGDKLFRVNQYWEWISTADNPYLINPLSAVLGLPREYITRNNGAYLVNTSIKEPNVLSTEDKKKLNDQLDKMIRHKYTFIHYNGIRKDKFKKLTDNFTKNIFDDSCVVIDEAHNLISRIVNKINKTNKYNERKKGANINTSDTLSLILYEFLLRAKNCKIVLLTGTPLINYPNEIGILFNILRGYIKTWTITLNPATDKTITTDTISATLLSSTKSNMVDYINYTPSTKKLVITRNPYTFETDIERLKENATKLDDFKYNGVYSDIRANVNPIGKVTYEPRGIMSDEQFIERITAKLNKADLKVIPNSIVVNEYTTLPDTLDEFTALFLDDSGNIKDGGKLGKRIIGLTSYFRSAQEELLPEYNKQTDRIILEIPMSDYQFQYHEKCRLEERQFEKQSKRNRRVSKDGLYEDMASTYRIFSRLACNFAMPKVPGRPTPKKVEQMNALNEIKNRLSSKYKMALETQYDISEQITEYYNAYLEANKDKLDSMSPQEMTKFKEKIKQYIMLFIDGKVTSGIQEYLDTGADIQVDVDVEVADEVAVEPVLKKARAKAQAQAKPREKKVKNTSPKAKKASPKNKTKKRVAFDEDGDMNLGGGGRFNEDADEEGDYKLYGGEGTPPEEIEVVDTNLDDINIDEVEEIINDTEIPVIEGVIDNDAKLREIEELEGDEILETMGNMDYKKAIKEALQQLWSKRAECLTETGLEIYSPKFLEMLRNITNRENRGLNLVYSQFRNMEGIAIFGMVLETNGFAKFKIKRGYSNNWELDMSEEDMGKPTYALYTGTEDSEEREIIRNIYNGDWNKIPDNIAAALRTKSTNNQMGEIIKVLMITSAGSEGINLRNTRFVHIMEPYWHPVRSEQVIGRARRICSHSQLPEEFRTVTVFIYIMVFTQAQLDSEYAVELKLNDLSKFPPFLPQTSDQKLFELSNVKEKIADQLSVIIKSTSIDCNIHSTSNNKEGIQCFRFASNPSRFDFAFNPDYIQDKNDPINPVNLVKEDKINDYQVVAQKGVEIAYMNKRTNDLYDYNKFKRGELEIVGRIVVKDGKKTIDMYKDKNKRK